MSNSSKKYIFLRVPKSLFYSFLLLLLFIAPFVYLYRKEVKRSVKLNTLHKKYLALIEKKISRAEKTYGGIPIPAVLCGVPFADAKGIVLNVKNMPIRNIEAPYNASISECGEGYRLFFRYDKIITGSNFPYHTFIGCCDLDSDFDQTGKEYVTIDTGSFYSEDPRIIKVNNKDYLVYNDLVNYESENKFYSLFNFSGKSINPPRTMFISELDKDLKPKFVTNLDIQLEWVEKNWVPFEYTDESNKTDIYFEYKRTPHKILKLENPKENILSHMNYLKGPPFQNLHWPKKWGSVRGGTPAKRVGDQYLAFFHSAFVDEDKFTWYIMGAYTFESKPPFRITGISQCPILFDGIYNSPHLNVANPTIRCIYPAGFVLGHDGEREVIHVSCGENDSAIKILTFDKDLLLKSLKKL